MLKADIRKIYKEKRRELSDAEKYKLEDLLLIQFQQSGIGIPTRIMTYAGSSKLHEIDPSLIMRYCHFINPEVVFYYPVIHEEEMFPVITDENTLFQLNAFGIEEPVDGTEVEEEDIDMVIVPLLAFDTKGNRVGYGKGYYDRFLINCREDCITVGLSYFEAMDEVIDADSFDVPLLYVITPNQSYSFI